MSRLEISEDIYSFLQKKNLKGLSLDTASFITICSEITNNFSFVLKNLSKEKMEKIQHQLLVNSFMFLNYVARPILQNDEIKIFLSKEVQEELNNILAYIAGEREKKRAEIVKKKLYIFKENEKMQLDYKKQRLIKQIENVPLSRNIKKKHIKILVESVKNDFLFLTASSNFVNSLKHHMADAEELFLFYHVPKSFIGF